MSEVSRRQVIKIASAGALSVLQSGAYGQKTIIDPTAQSIPQWDVFEASWKGADAGNPFVDVQLSATFTIGARKVEVEGFYDGGGVYKVRFMPDVQGVWQYTTHSNRKELDGKAGLFTCVGAKANAHGPVQVVKTAHFAFADGTPYFPFGTTCYAWIHQSEQIQKETLETLRTAPFNKLRMCVFPKSYEYNHNEPALYPFERSSDGKSNYSRPNPAFYAHLEQRILELQAMGIEVDLILFHPYDRWGYSTMQAAEDDHYLRYIVARLSSFRNVWWSVGNEYDLVRAKTMPDWDRFFHILEQYDAYAHLRSVHFSKIMYDYSHPWITHASLQASDFDAADTYRKQWNKPVVFDEVGYEGNLNRRWGCLSGTEMTHRFWAGIVHGAYMTHGETLLEGEANFKEEATPTLWWSHGGKLRGTSPQRIAFLRKLTEEMVASSSLGMGWDSQADPYYPNAMAYSDSQGKDVSTVLYYFDLRQPIWYEFPLPAGEYAAEHIDPEAMTITPIQGRFSGKTKLTLTGKPYQAVRFRRLS